VSIECCARSPRTRRLLQRASRISSSRSAPRKFPTSTRTSAGAATRASTQRARPAARDELPARLAAGRRPGAEADSNAAQRKGVWKVELGGRRPGSLRGTRTRAGRAGSFSSTRSSRCGAVIPGDGHLVDQQWQPRIAEARSDELPGRRAPGRRHRPTGDQCRCTRACLSRAPHTIRRRCPGSSAAAAPLETEWLPAMCFACSEKRKEAD